MSDGQYDNPNWAYDECCGKCRFGTCYIDRMTGEANDE